MIKQALKKPLSHTTRTKKLLATLLHWVFQSVRKPPENPWIHFLGQKPLIVDRGLRTVDPERSSQYSSPLWQTQGAHLLTWPKSTIVSKPETALNSDETPGSNARNSNWEDITVLTVTARAESPWGPARERTVCWDTSALFGRKQHWSIVAECLQCNPTDFRSIHKRGLETILRKLKRLASLPSHNTERVLKSGISLSSPSTAPT